MHILLTDILTCPRCGPAFGLILLADRVRDRRIESGVLGCSNCREKYPIRDYTGWFAAGSSAATASAPSAEVERLAALIGIGHGPANIVIGGPAAAAADRIAALLDDVEVVALVESGAPTGLTPGVSRIVVGSALPIATDRVAGVGLTGASADALLEEGARVVTPVGRLVLEPIPARAAERLESAGLRIAAQEGATAVAVR